MPFNKTKPYGEVNGPSIPYRYEQGDKYYDHQLNEITQAGEPVAGGEYILPEDEAKPQTIKPQQEPKPQEEESNPVPEIGIEPVSDQDAEVDNLDELKSDEIREQLDRLGIGHTKNMLKPDLKALLREELNAAEMEVDDVAQG